MKLITLYVGERLDHVVQFDGVSPETETYIIERQDHTQLFAFYHALGQTASVRRYGKKDTHGSIILQTDVEESHAYINEIKAERKSDSELAITVNLSLTPKDEIDLKTLEGNCLSFNCHSPNLWPLELLADDIQNTQMVNVKLVLDAGKKYERELKLCVAPASNIYDIVLDFGSEASQMGVFRRDRELTEHGIHKLFDEMKEVLQQKGVVEQQNVEVEQPTNEVEHPEGIVEQPPKEVEKHHYVQYDVDEHLYKSVFFAHKDLQWKTQDEPIHLASTNKDVKSLQLDNELKMLTSYEEANALVKEQNYIQVPNVKITQFGGVSIPELGQGSADDTIDAFAYIYRASINKFVYNALRNMQENQCVNLYVLMPNVYSPVDVVEHLQQLRKDINATILKNDMKVKAVELSALSESDASLLGAFEVIKKYQKKQPDDGTYIIIDAGKGTLDFSALRFEWTNSGLQVHSIFRDGLIGAGNSLTYAYLYALTFDYFKALGISNLNDDILREFIFSNVLGGTQGGKERGGGDLAELLNLMKALENYKMSVSDKKEDTLIDPLKDNKAKQSNHLEVRMEALTLFVQNMITNNRYKPLSEQANQYVSKTIQQIVSKVCDKTKGLGRLKSTKDYKPANGVIFAGRAFCLQVFKDAMRRQLEEGGIVEPDSEQSYISESRDWKISQKNVCLYIRNLSRVYNSRMSSMPWVEYYESTDDKQQGKWIQHIMRIIPKFFMKKNDGAQRSFNINDLINTRGSSFQTPGSIDENWLVTGCDLSVGPKDILVIGSTMYSGKYLQGDIQVFFTGGSKFKYRYLKDGKYYTEELKNNGLNIDTSYFCFGTQFPNVKPSNVNEVTLPFNSRDKNVTHGKKGNTSHPSYAQSKGRLLGDEERRGTTEKSDSVRDKLKDLAERI